MGETIAGGYFMGPPGIDSPPPPENWLALPCNIIIYSHYMSSPQILPLDIPPLSKILK